MGMLRLDSGKGSDIAHRMPRHRKGSKAVTPMFRGRPGFESGSQCRQIVSRAGFHSVCVIRSCCFTFCASSYAWSAPTDKEIG